MIKNIYPGKFIVFDGLDGSGLSTQSSLLIDWLNQEAKEKFGRPMAWLTKEPTKNMIGGLINAQLDHHWQSSPECLQLLFSADRLFHLEKEIIPKLEKGITVVCDRYLFSTLAYGAFSTNDMNWLMATQEKAIFPDLTFFLKVNPETAIKRINQNRFETTLFEKEKIFESVWSNYEILAAKFENIHIIDGERTISVIADEIKNIVKRKLGL